jgi:hypothetical protein
MRRASKASPAVIAALALMGCGGANQAKDAAGLDGPAAEVADDVSPSDASSATLPDGACAVGAYRQTGVCACQPDQPVVCGGVCTDLQNDDESCGECGHACAAEATCVAGVCGPEPAILQPPTMGSCKSMDIAVSGGTLFWADEAAGAVRRAPATGGPPTPIAVGEDGPKSIAVQGSMAYWLVGKSTSGYEAAQTLRAAPIDGGPVQTIVSPPDGVGGFVVSPDGQTIFFSTSTMIERISAAAPSAPVLVANEEKGGIPRALALDGVHIAYPTSLNGDVDGVELADGQVARCGLQNPDGTLANVNCVRLGRLIEGPIQIVAHAGKVYWADYQSLKANDFFPMPDNGADTIGSRLPDGTVQAIAIGGDKLFYSGFDPRTPLDATVAQTALVQDAPEVRLARVQNAPTSLASDGARIYWSTADCAIRSTPTLP